jgi:regulator of protease activity HflC (stomatin/prohibitin superfamily)
MATRQRALARTAWSSWKATTCWSNPSDTRFAPHSKGIRIMSSFLIALVILVVIAALFIKFTVKVVPQQNAWVVQRWGKYNRTLSPGLKFIIPFFDRVAYKHSLKEIPLDVPSQVCITRDNTQLQVDGILYFQVTDPMRASYGASNYVVAITQLAQTTLRSIVGKMELDKTFEERDLINAKVVEAIDEAALNWGVKVLRYEIKDLTPPAEILRAMQAQITAERGKRAVIATSEGKRQEEINLAEGQKQAAIAKSEGEKQAAINIAQGQAAAITEVATATAVALARVGAAIRQPGGHDAVQLKVAEKAVEAYSQLAQQSKTTLVVPSNMTEVSALISSAMKMVQAQRDNDGRAIDDLLK